MRVRTMRPGELPRVKAVYEARTAASVGLIRRSAASWRGWRRRKRTRGLWIVAEDRAAIVAYGVASMEGGSGGLDEVVWLPGHNDAGTRLLDELLRRLHRRRAALIGAQAMAGSPLLPLLKRTGLDPIPEMGVFMAAVTDARALLRDAKRILLARTKLPIRLRIGRMSVNTGKGRPCVTATMDARVLLGLLLGLRSLRVNLRRGTVSYAPRTGDALEALRAAFPERTFSIQDTW